MPTISDIRQQYPQYNDMSDQELGDALHAKFYSDMPKDQFEQKIGIAQPSVLGTLEDVGKSAFTHAANAFLPMVKGGQAVMSLFDPTNIPAAVATAKAQPLKYQTQTKPGQYAATVGDFTPGLLAGPEGLIPRVTNVVAPALASEALGQATRGTAYEPYARMAGALLGSGGTSLLERTAPSAGIAAGAGSPLAEPSPVGNLVSQVASMPSGLGAKTLQTAFQAGKAGGPASEAFKAAMTGKTSPEEIVNQAQSALADLKAARSAAYRSGMADVSKDQTVLSFDPIDKALAQSNNVATFKGVDLKPKVAGIRNEVQALVDNWKQLDPAQFHTPEGFDALKQQIGDLRDDQPYGSQARLIVDNAYNAVKNAIVNQSPAYADTMKSYWQASDEIKNIQKTLSLNPNASIDTSLRKLLSVMRDGVNANFGERAKLVSALDKDGTLTASLAGATARPWAPQGISRYVASGEGLAAGAAALHNPALAASLLAGLPASSPRVMGSAAYGLGAASRAVPSLPVLARYGALPLANSAARGYFFGPQQQPGFFGAFAQ